ncbi:MAG: hypothetical protein HZA90_14340 [Verrucomicrobia bacterium]|nr:hypothetical protein [Verrucomicrobiota bacterium]
MKTSITTQLSSAENLSYLDPRLPRATFKCVLKHYAASMLIYGALWLILRLNPWFRGLLDVPFGSFPAWRFYDWYLVLYALVAPAIYFTFRPRTLWLSKNVLILGWLARVAWCALGQAPPNVARPWAPTFKEKHAFVFLLIKLVYGPLMLNSLCLEYNAYPALLMQYQQSASLVGLADALYALFVTTVFCVDSGLFCFGYHAEAFWLKNPVRYVETSLSGLLVCLLCYAPFNMVTAAFFGSSNDDPHILFHGELHHPLTWILRGLAVLCLLLLTSASLSLFTKASNLTHRGIVAYGPYALVRHPGYVGKNLFWLVTLIPALFAVDTADAAFSWRQHLLFCTATAGGFIAWCSIYVLRALTEERLLLRDPEYAAYCRKVKYRFIPGIV